ncbi:iron complex transport system substrate-binding protein [Hephaestia caeni]|uniref:Iron complex transport system substrate-binding protein n=1 Tax=Hephaestia caeni TaxID=645617 RepID=A0A397PKJ9_9SPHN|nr:ABC transporter substrate-binding protein [Hephaestia caeni]RIA46201.1 iron complex transport system substrate-binding protein [Hephaestia caeni]
MNTFLVPHRGRREFLAGASLFFLVAPVRVSGAAPAAGTQTRVVCIGGAITEILYALGQQAQIVAVDTTSQFPSAALKEKRNVGYMRAVSAEGVLSMRPTLILAMRDAGPPQALDQLRASGIRFVTIDNTLSPEAVTARVRQLAALFKVDAQGARLNRTIDGGFRELAAYRRAHPARKRVLFVLSLQNGRPMVAGKGTEADAIIGLAGGINAAGALDGYKPVSDEALAALAPDAVLAMDHAGPGIDVHALDTPGFRLTPAGRRRALIKMDGSYLLGLGPRTPAAALDLARRLQAI